MTTLISDPRQRALSVKAKALALGFDAVGIASAEAPAEQTKRLESFLSQGRHGDMAWMEARKDERASPQGLWPEARSVIMLGVNYGPPNNPLARLGARRNGVISVYAQNRDYHDVIKKRLKTLGRWMVEAIGGDVKVFVDTAPVMEKPLAARSGIGWQGKHTNLVSKAWGSWLFLGAVLATEEIAADAEENDHCGSCRRCLDVCPTDAFPAPYELDARLCISYLTIEHKGPIPRALRPLIGNRIYGCDDCLAVCPWNKFAQRARESAFHARNDLEAPLLGELASFDDPEFRTFFKGSPIKRIGRDRFVRNVLIAIGNSGAIELMAAVGPRLEDASPLVRGAAVWAARRLLDEDAFATLREEHATSEEDACVKDEWRSG